MTAEDVHKKVANAVAAVITGVVLTLLLSLIMMIIWNTLIPDMFGLKKIAYYQAVGFFILCKILFRDKLIREDCACSVSEEEEAPSDEEKS